MNFIRGNKRVHILLILATAFSLLFIHIAKAVTAEPGTPEDPIVSQSYVDSKISALSNELNILKQQMQSNTQSSSQLDTKVKAIESELSDLKKQVQIQSGQGGKFEVVGPVQPGKRY